MKWWDRIIGWLPWFAGAFIIAGIVHICAILSMPRLAPLDSYTRMETMTLAGRIVPLPPLTPGKEFAPFEDPAMVASVCRYDLDRGPLRVRGNFAADNLVLLSFHSRYGDVFYSMTDRSATRGVLDILLVTPAQLTAIEAYDSEDELPSELRLTTPQTTGFVILRSLAAQPGGRDAARARLQSITCAVDQSTPG